MLVKTIKAKYKNGVLELLENVDLPEGINVGIRFESIEPFSEEEKTRRFSSSAGGWKNLLDCEKFLKDVYESRKVRTRPPVNL